MTVGISTVNLANAWLNTLSNTSFAAGASIYMHLHTGDPGSAGTSNQSQNTDGPGKSLTWAAASSGSKALAATLPSWTLAGLSAPTTETITHVSVRSASTAGGGTFWFSAAVTNKSVSNGDVLSMTSFSVSLTPLAA